MFETFQIKELINKKFRELNNKFCKFFYGKYLTIPPITNEEATELIPKDGQIIYLSDTGGVFVSVGFWGYENGSWVKL